MKAVLFMSLFPWLGGKSLLQLHPISRRRTPDDPSLDPQGEILLTSFKFTAILRCELAGAELDLDLVKGAAELERHLCVVFVDHRRSRVFADIEAFVERESNRLGQLDAAFRDFLAVNRKRPLSTLAGAPAVIGKVESNDVFARRELISRRYAVLVLLLNRILVAILIGKRIGEHGFAVEHKQAPTAKASALSDDDPVGPTLGDINVCADAVRLVLDVRRVRLGNTDHPRIVSKVGPADVEARAQGRICPIAET